MTIEAKQFNYFAISASVTLVVYLGGALYALATNNIEFTDFLAAVSGPLGLMTGWAAKKGGV